MLDQGDTPVIPRFGVGPDGEPASADSAPGAAEAGAAGTGSAESGAGESGAGESVVPRYWTIGDQEPVASQRHAPTTGAERGPDESIIVIRPEDIVSQGSGPGNDAGPSVTTEAREDTAPRAAGSAPADWSGESGEFGAPGERGERGAPGEFDERGESGERDQPGTHWADAEDDEAAARVAGPSAEAVPGEAVLGEAVPDEAVPGEAEAGDGSAEAEAEVAGGVEVVSEPEDNVADGRASAIFADDERWHGIMVSFLDDPRMSVEEAASHVDEEIAGYVALLSRRQEVMRESWHGNQDTEALRIALRSYRDFRKQLAEIGTALLAGPN